MEKNDKKKKIVFSEEIDNTISGFSLVLTFVVVGIFWIFNKQYFGNEKVAKTIQWIFIIFGTLGFCTEISKFKKQDKKKIEGIDNVVVGFICILIWFLIYRIFNNLVTNIVGFIVLIIGSFGTFRGIIEIGYSIHKLKKENIENKHNVTREIINNVLVLVTNIAGIALVAIQLLQVLIGD